MEERQILKCQRCGWTWAPKRGGTPATCAKCRSPYWNKPRKETVGAEPTAS